MSAARSRPLSPVSAGATPDAAALLGALARLLAPLVAEAIAAQTSDYYDQSTAPVGKRRFLAAARAGEFPSAKRGKLVLAKRIDVDAWIARGARPTMEPVAPMEPVPTDENARLLAAAGITCNRKGGR